ncbi:hypothetical protein [Lolliginicoccus levis]|uniref:hypothetical protein n=1 Tax=Lolliginicoccus levis TaxID=2919542 RepID=UPI00241D1E23|nr:hypothetical protein [Lolliginicoccus levis]
MRDEKSTDLSRTRQILSVVAGFDVTDDYVRALGYDSPQLARVVDALSERIPGTAFRRNPHARATPDEMRGFLDHFVRQSA